MLAAGMLGVYALAIEPRFVRRHDVTVPLPGLPASFDGYRILQISDLESESLGSLESQVAEIAGQARPDLVVVTGDLVGKDLPRELRLRHYGRMASWLAGLPAADGVWLVQGHGERRGRIPEDELERLMRSAGVRMLRDDITVIRRRESTLWLAGVRQREYGGEGRWVLDSPRRARRGPSPGAGYLELDGAVCEDTASQELSGRLRFTSPEDAAGFLLRSHLGRGEERRYLVQRHAGSPRLSASVRGSAFSRGRRDGAPIAAGRWHRFRVQALREAEGMRVRGRCWADGAAEPEGWDVDYLDDSPSGIREGCPGLYAKGPGTKEFDDLSWGSGGAAAWREPRGSDLLAALGRRAGEGEQTVILLAHTPDIFPDAVAARVSLVLAGHTQGGQIRLPGLGALITSTRLGRSFDRGLFRRGETTMYITGGVGTTRLPVRFLSPPEAALITLRPAAGPDS